MAVAPEVIAAGAAEEGAAAEGSAAAGRTAQAAAAGPRPGRQRSTAQDWLSSGQGAWQRLPSGGASSTVGQTITKLIWAVAIGLIVLQIAAEATGQRWSFSLPSGGKPLQPEGYAPLYAGQAQVGHSMPWVPVTVTGPSPGQLTPGASSGGSFLQP